MDFVSQAKVEEKVSNFFLLQVMMMVLPLLIFVLLPKVVKKKKSKKTKASLEVHVYNPSNLGGRGRRMAEISKLAWST